MPAGNSSSDCDNHQNQTRDKLETAHNLYHEKVSLSLALSIRPYWVFTVHLAIFIYVHFYRYNIEVSGGLGPTVGVVWRIGLMGHNSRSDIVDRVIAAMEDALKHCTTAKL